MKTILQKPWYEDIIVPEPPDLIAHLVDDTAAIPLHDILTTQRWRISYRLERRERYGAHTQYGGRLLTRHLAHGEVINFDTEDTHIRADVLSESANPNPNRVKEVVAQRLNLPYADFFASTHPPNIIVVDAPLPSRLNVAISTTGFTLYRESYGYRFWGSGPEDDVPEPAASETMWSPTPIRGWRVWTRPQLGLLMGVKRIWHPGWNEAVCLSEYETHPPGLPVPEWGCSCGFYATKEMGRATRGTGLLGQVEMAGRVIEHEHGWRAQSARIVWLDPAHLHPADAQAYGADPITGRIHYDEDR